MSIFLVLHFLFVCASFKHISANFENEKKRMFFGCSTPFYKKELFFSELCVELAEKISGTRF